jgi:hypothetical protein
MALKKDIFQQILHDNKKITLMTIKKTAYSPLNVTRIKQKKFLLSQRRTPDKD